LLLGNDLEVVLAGLDRDHTGAQELHLLERINLDFAVQNTIVPDALNLAKFKVSGKLPELKVNLSNQKYKGIMRIVDVAIPKFGDDVETPAANKSKEKHNKEPARPSALPLPSNVFSRPAGYEIRDVDVETSSSSSQDFFEANDGETDLQLHQHAVEFSFAVEKLQASLYKTAPDGTEKLLADTVLEGFALQFAMAKFNMDVDIKLRCVASFLPAISNYMRAG
jgi:vacuolar protein sorting-associated protein 13A/C